MSVGEEVERRPGRFSGFMGAVRLLFDGVLLLFVIFFIGFFVFANGIDRVRTFYRHRNWQ